MILTSLLERYAEYCVKRGIDAFARSKEKADAGDNDASVFWYRKYLRYSKRHNKCLKMIERK